MSEGIAHPPTHRSLHIDKRDPANPKEIKNVSPDTLLIIDTWNESKDVWTIDGVITKDVGFKWITKLEEGKNYTIEKILDNQGNFVAFYCDVTSPIKISNNGYEFKDWYLDVFQAANNLPQILDEDEFEAAIEAGYLTEEEAKVARKAANELMDLLEKNFFDTSNNPSI